MFIFCRINLKIILCSKFQEKIELSKLLVLKDKNFIKVITGVRRAGNRTLLQQFQELLKAENPNVSIISINMDLPEFRFLAEKTGKKFMIISKLVAKK